MSAGLRSARELRAELTGENLGRDWHVDAWAKFNIDLLAERCKESGGAVLSQYVYHEHTGADWFCYPDSNVKQADVADRLRELGYRVWDNVSPMGGNGFWFSL